MVKIVNINKHYSRNKGNFDINLEFKDGNVYGILGPNGAGKTTLIRQIMGFIKSTSGEIDIDGVSPWNNNEIIMKTTGYVAGEVVLYSNMTGRQYLNFISKMKEVNDEFKENLIKHFDFDIDMKIKKMSKGMKQKVSLIAAAMIKPKLLILDEPTSGLDPIMQEQFNSMIDRLKKDGTTIILCSHIMEEVALICDKIGIIKDGKIVKELEVNNMTNLELGAIFKDIYKVEKFI